MCVPTAYLQTIELLFSNQNSGAVSKQKHPQKKENIPPLFQWSITSIHLIRVILLFPPLKPDPHFSPLSPSESVETQNDFAIFTF